jgi:hypothetical protein
LMPSASPTSIILDDLLLKKPLKTNFLITHVS